MLVHASSPFCYMTFDPSLLFCLYVLSCYRLIINSKVQGKRKRKKGNEVGKIKSKEKRLEERCEATKMECKRGGRF